MNKIQNKYFLVSFAMVLLFIIGNNSDYGIKKYKRYWDCKGHDIIDSLRLVDNYLYPSNLDQLNVEEILAHCYEGTTIDSSLELLEHVTNQIYTIANKDSEMEIIHYQSKNGHCGFHVLSHTLNSNIFKIENGIQIGMTKENFLRKFHVKNVDCETLFVNPGGSYMDYYKFYFKHDRLKRIEKDIVEL